MTPPTTTALSPHHDGSAMYVEPGRVSLGDRVTIRVRTPNGFAREVMVRTTPDSEPTLIEASVEAADEHETWWAAELPIENPLTNYRFVFDGGERLCVLNEAGLFSHEQSDAADFLICTDGGGPSWLADAVGYQIFPDRFAQSGAQREAPDWALPSEWDDPVIADEGHGVRQLYGGDLDGVVQRLDYLAQLGINLIYLTPFFESRSNHRYDAVSFDHVDALLGGDDALARLTAAAGRRGMRVIGDLTLNHSGSNHEWFQRAIADGDAPEAGFYAFVDHPHHYRSFPGAPTLPKFDFRSDELRRRLFGDADAPVRRWLREPFGLSGWRIDVAASAARFADVDLNLEVARLARSTAIEERSDAWLVAEHAYDARTELGRGGWHGVMAYHWFTRPLWSWLRRETPVALMGPGPIPRIDGAAAARSMRSLAAGVPWSARLASMTMLDSHDTARARTALAPGGHRVAAVALYTMPGVPTLFAGSEVGVAGENMDECRVPFPWDEHRWDRGFHDDVRRLIALRRSLPALQVGGLRWVSAAAESLTYLRETADQRVLVHLCRSRGQSIAVPPMLADLSNAEVVFGDDLVEPTGSGLSLACPMAAAMILRLD
jgi:alpha-glucosidase